ncbi:hypothetical protein Q5P01_002101 [Channa striata]|uniref:Uncharacterized protein n=1 Tax=Channa striata TaxID=64152 RepID=A0AA88P024_CHASR|nr:hypothetical protein Q5P01_002101 [Channa striata]
MRIVKSELHKSFYPNTERGAFQALRVADATAPRDDLHSLQEEDALAAQGKSDGFKRARVDVFPKWLVVTLVAPLLLVFIF